MKIPEWASFALFTTYYIHTYIHMYIKRQIDRRREKGVGWGRRKERVRILDYALKYMFDRTL